MNLGYEVHGIIRRNSVPENQSSRLGIVYNDLHLHYGDLQDSASISRVLQEVQPDEIYNLGAQSHVRISFETPIFTTQVNALGALNLIEAMKTYSPEARFYQASSSEMFGKSQDEDGYQRETTPMSPVSPYGCAKLFAYSAVRNYRHAYNLFLANGILFNHESPRRGSNFVTTKIVKTAVEIALGLETKLILGNLQSYRDWGHSKDYVRAMHMILNHERPDDFVVATGSTHSVQDFVDKVFSILNLSIEEHLGQDARYMRPEELPYLRGDSSKVRSELGWRPEISFDELVEEMVREWHDLVSRQL